MNGVDPEGLISPAAREWVDRAMRMSCGNSRDAHDYLMMERISRNWEALTPQGNALRIAENYLTAYDNITNPALGKYTPRPLAYWAVGIAGTSLWQGMRWLDNFNDNNMNSPASIEALAAGYEGANDALAHYLTGGRNGYECICKR